MRPILVFGGTFDPVHNGHLAIADQAREATDAEAVWFVPASLAPLRDPPRATPEERFELLEAACAGWGSGGLTVLDIAIRSGGVSYTAEVMDALRAEHPGLDLSVLIGADAARTIHSWHRAGDLLRSERFVIVNRTGSQPLDPVEMGTLGFAASRTTLLTLELAGHQRVRGPGEKRTRRTARRAGSRRGRRTHRRERDVPPESGRCIMRNG